MSTDKCAPNKNDGTCFPTPVVKNIVEKMNVKTGSKIEISDNGKKMMNEVRNELNCDDDMCVIKRDILGDNKNELLDKYFKPAIPLKWEDNPIEWASTTDIDDVLKQYEGKYDDFKYLGAVPIDFDKKMTPDMCVSDDLCKIDAKGLWKDGKRRVGMVFNLDPHDKPGSHWVSMLIDKNGGIYYFDSVGKYPPVEVERLMDRVANQLNDGILDGTVDKNDIDDTHAVDKVLSRGAKRGDDKLYINNTDFLVMGGILFIRDTPYKISEIRENFVKVHPKLKANYSKGERIVEKCWRGFYNDVGHQTENTECGIYSMYFISQLLEGKRFSDFLGKRIPDNEMVQYRKKFFRPREDIDVDLNI